MAEGGSSQDADSSTLQKAWNASWWAKDFSWEGLAAKPSGAGTLQDYWRKEAGDLIPEPGSDRLWTRFHCPFVFADRSPSPKVYWENDEWRSIAMALKLRLANGTATEPCDLRGVMLYWLHEPAEHLTEDGSAALWLVADNAHFQDIDLSHNDLAHVSFADTWFSHRASFKGVRVRGGHFATAMFRKEPDFAGAVIASHVGRPEMTNLDDRVAHRPTAATAVEAVVTATAEITEERPQALPWWKRLLAWVKAAFAKFED